MYFVYKHINWSTENKYRFVVAGDEDGSIELPFFDLLAGVVVGAKCKHGFMNIIGAFTQEMNIPCVYLYLG
ncbi:hypothetical protein ACJJJB_11605 [Microbulbifer sp. ANSA001]|uniref:hypothetical protein n=1 Tax=Microbulbifer sp. ANSA001 TaxID=3243358 RepID=UPI0040419F08